METINIDIDKLIGGYIINENFFDNIINIDIDNIIGYDALAINKLLGGGLFSSCGKKHQIITDVQQTSNIMEQLFPSSLVDGVAYKTIIMLSNQVSSLSPKSTFGMITEKVVQTTSATGAAVATYGAGGDIAVNFVFTIKDGLIFAAKIIQMIENLSRTLTERVITQSQEVKTVVSDDAIRFITNIVSIDFKEGIDGVECWVGDIMEHFKNTDARVFACDIFKQIYPELINFISNLMGTMIPNVGVVIKESILYVMKKDIGKNIMLNQIINQLKKQYKKIPKMFRRMLENPELLEKDLNDKYQSFQTEIHKMYPDVKAKHDEMQQNGGIYIPGMSLVTSMAKKATQVIGNVTGLDKVLIDQLVKLDVIITTIEKNIRLVTYMIHKLLALTFSILFVLKSCSIQQK